MVTVSDLGHATPKGCQGMNKQKTIAAAWRITLYF
jgi:hypothetical protein